MESKQTKDNFKKEPIGSECSFDMLSYRLIDYYLENNEKSKSKSK